MLGRRVAIGWQSWQHDLRHVSGYRAGVAGIYNRATYAKEMREASLG